MTSIISSLTNLYSTSTSKISSESVNSAEETGETQTTSANTGVYNKYDTLELSQDYLSYKTQSESGTLSDETNLLNSETGEVMPPPLPPEELSADITAVDESLTEDAAAVTGTDETSTTSTDETSGTEKPMGPPPPPMNDSEDSDTDSTDLSSYSESELKALVENGTITRAQYIVEMASREAENNTETDSENTTSTESTASV